jgi:RHS repeat-associated protein
MSTSSGTLDSSVAYFPYGDLRNSQGNLGTDKRFTGQRLDSTGLYYYGARYYDATIGRFISADTIVQSFSNPQTLNRYSYCLNNPLKYTDPTGHDQQIVTNDDGTYAIMDGQGNFLGTATGIDDLASKMAEYSAVSRNVDLPLGEHAANFFNEIKPVVWGYYDEIVAVGVYYHSIIMSKDGQGNYFKTETWGGGLTIDGGYRSGLYCPGQSGVAGKNFWGIELGVKIGFIGWEGDIGVSYNSNSGLVGSFGENKDAYLALTTPGPVLTVSRTTVTQIDKKDIYNDMPRWVWNAYNYKGYKFPK